MVSGLFNSCFSLGWVQSGNCICMTCVGVTLPSVMYNVIQVYTCNIIVLGLGLPDELCTRWMLCCPTALAQGKITCQGWINHYHWATTLYGIYEIATRLSIYVCLCTHACMYVCMLPKWCMHDFSRTVQWIIFILGKVKDHCLKEKVKGKSSHLQETNFKNIVGTTAELSNRSCYIKERLFKYR